MKQEAQQTFEEEDEFLEEKDKTVTTEGEETAASKDELSKEVEEQKPAEDRLVIEIKLTKSYELKTDQQLSFLIIPKFFSNLLIR